MSSAVISIPVSEELLHHIAEQASRTGIPTEEWISAALAERVQLEQWTQSFF
jgi:predicted DNA binding CopG/RHH family protein